MLLFMSQLALKGARPLIASLRERKLDEPKVLLLSILACAIRRASAPQVDVWE
jgi:hypothetical protein